MDVYDGRLATEFNTVDPECRRSSLCSPEELDMERDCVRLVLLCELRAEMGRYNLEYTSCYVSAIRNYMWD
jgi:hypothetical protein